MSEFDEGIRREVDEHMPQVCNADIDEVLEIVKKSMKKDECWYLVDKKWFEQCEQFILDKEPAHNPGPIDNSNLFKSTTTEFWELKNQLDEERDYKLIPEEAWHILVGYFGIQDEKHSIKRLAIEQGSFSSYCIVEVYPLELKLCRHGQGTKVTKYYSRNTTLYELVEDMKRIFKVDSAQPSRIYQNKTLLDTEMIKVHGSRTLSESGFQSGDTITLESKSLNGAWPSNFSRGSGIVTRSHGNSGSISDSRGLCGLMNLGNTCFMNSALQCLSNTPPLTEFIISDKYLEEINEDNPLGMGGEIAKTYGELIKNMWLGDSNCIAPREFKFAVGRFAPQFSGYAQQDCQELMAFLLDGLHEDLNRVTKKPYIEVKTDVDIRPDHVVAQESWENYKKRNDSIIVDTFHGLLKSTLVCPDCELVSVTFDPFCYLSLPLPFKQEKKIDVIFVPAYTKSTEKNRKIQSIAINRLLIPKYGSVSDISKAVAKVVNDEKILLHKIDPSKLRVADVYNHRICKVFENDEDISMSIVNLVVYEMLDYELSVPVYLREVKPNEPKTLFGRPFFIGVNDSQFDTIYDTVTENLKSFLKIPVCDDSSDSTECDKGSRMFSLSLINSFGTVDMENIDRSNPIQLNNNSYIAVDLPTSASTEYEEELLKNSYKINPQKTNSKQKTVIPLSECIVNFTTTEKLGADDLWYCPACKEHKGATKKFDLYDLPKVLIIQLKRFSYTRFWRDKLDAFVDYPVTALDMGKYVINNPDNKPILYDLIAVANHYGGLGGGHYTAYANNSLTQSWYHFNDSNVSLASEKNVVSKDGYVLFYLKRT